MKKNCRKICNGLWIGGVAIALTVVLSKKECREKMMNEVKEAKETVCDSFRFIRDNREQILDQVRETANEVSAVVRGISDDVKQLSETAVHLKESSKEVVQATKEAATEIKTLKKDE